MTRDEQYKLKLYDCKKLFSLKWHSLLQSLNLILGVKDAHANLSCIIVIIILFRGPSTDGGLTTGSSEDVLGAGG